MHRQNFQAVPLLVLITVSCFVGVISAHEHAGCGQHSPLAIKQQQLLAIAL